MSERTRSEQPSTAPLFVASTCTTVPVWELLGAAGGVMTPRSSNLLLTSSSKPKGPLA